MTTFERKPIALLFRPLSTTCDDAGAPDTAAASLAIFCSSHAANKGRSKQWTQGICACASDAQDPQFPKRTAVCVRLVQGHLASLARRLHYSRSPYEISL